MMRVLSLGAGVQSSTLLLMASEGEFGEERPHVAIFADTQCEPEHTYNYLNYLKKVSRIPIEVVSAGPLMNQYLDAANGSHNHFVSLPLYVINTDNSKGMLQRQCTKDFKILPLRKKYRNIAKKGEQVETWIGISRDEYMRMKPSGLKWCVNRWPLVEKGMYRGQCIKWLTEHGYQIPKKSACIICPYHDDDFWNNLKIESPNEFIKACEFDEGARKMLGKRGMKGIPYLHRSCVPLREVKFDIENPNQLDLFQNECEGMCGV